MIEKHGKRAFDSRFQSSTFCKIHLIDLPRCGAKRRRKDERCKAIAMANGRCRLHGGKSTGPKTPEGRERSKRANLKHGEYSQEAKAMRRALNEEYRLFMAVLKQVKKLS